MQIIQSSSGDVTIVGNNQDLVITNSGGIISVNGVDIVGENSHVKLTVKIEGDVGNITVQGGGNVEAWKNVSGAITTKSGDVRVFGNVNGGISTMSGDVETNEVWGNVSTMSGDIRHK